MMIWLIVGELADLFKILLHELLHKFFNDLLEIAPDLSSKSPKISAQRFSHPKSTTIFSTNVPRALHLAWWWWQSLNDLQRIQILGWTATDAKGNRSTQSLLEIPINLSGRRGSTNCILGKRRRRMSYCSICFRHWRWEFGNRNMDFGWVGTPHARAQLLVKSSLFLVKIYVQWYEYSTIESSISSTIWTSKSTIW